MDIGASQNIQVFRCLRRPETNFMHGQFQQHPRALLGTINIIRNTKNAVH